MYCINEFVWTWTKRNPNLTSFVRKSHNFCDAKAYALYHVYSQYQARYSTAIHACTVQCECSQQRRYTCIPQYTPLHAGFTILVHMSNCMQCLIFFTCVSFVLYLKFIKYQIYYGLIFYLSLNDSLNLKSPPAIAITCKTTQQIIKKERKKERNNKQQQQINLQNSII